MPSFHFTKDTISYWDTGLDAETANTFRTIHFRGDLGGGILVVYTVCEGVRSAVPNARLFAGETDSFGEPVNQYSFLSSGQISVLLLNANNPDALVSIR